MLSSESLPVQNRKVFGTVPTAIPDKEDEGFISATFLKWATAALLAYFGARLVFFALNISSFVPPDEVTHAGLCKIFSNVFLLPENSPATYEFGLVTNTAWFYYWVMGKLLHLNIFGVSDLVFLRLLNIPLAFATVWYALRLLRLLTDNRLTKLLLVVIITNTPMFSLLSASVSYDNLANLLAAMAIYYEFAYFKNRSGGLLVASLLCQMSGSLTKITFLPLILVLNVLLVLNEVITLKTQPKEFRQLFRKCSRWTLLTLLLLIIAVGLNLRLYAGNYLRYGAPNPGMSQVISPESAMQSRLDARGMIFNQYKEGKISYMEALILTGEIKHPGDKADTFYLLMNYEKLKRNPQLWLSPLNYANFWFQTMAASIFGIRAHLGMFKPPLYLLPVYVVMALAFLGFVIRWRPGEAGWSPLSLAVVAVSYAGFLVYEVNYDAYHNYGEPSLTVYGRYLFIVMAPVYVLLCHYLLRLFRSEFIRTALALATTLLFVLYDFPWFLMHATAEWYTWMPQ
ncbi:MAG: hypothetical protein JJE30_00115 [Desulfuromonadales bacterium]|nr:hypothetical protein [Desulfuromonadales bacterium]